MVTRRSDQGVVNALERRGFAVSDYVVQFAGVECALLDAGLPVKLGDITHEDNEPVTFDRFYGE